METSTTTNGTISCSITLSMFYLVWNADSIWFSSSFSYLFWVNVATTLFAVTQYTQRTMLHGNLVVKQQSNAYVTQFDKITVTKIYMKICCNAYNQGPCNTLNLNLKFSNFFFFFFLYFILVHLIRTHKKS